MSFAVEALVHGVWSRLHAGSSDETTLFATRDEAEGAIPELASNLDADPEDFRVVELCDSTKPQTLDFYAVFRRKNMTLEACAERVAGIEKIRGDDECAHEREDELHQDVLAWVANEAPEPFKSVAAKALATLNIKFARWYA